VPPLRALLAEWGQERPGLERRDLQASALALAPQAALPHRAARMAQAVAPLAVVRPMAQVARSGLPHPAVAVRLDPQPVRRS
jgi:hypothetical protein